METLNLHIKTHEAWKEGIPRTPGPLLKCKTCNFKTASKVVFRSHSKNSHKVNVTNEMAKAGLETLELLNNTRPKRGTLGSLEAEKRDRLLTSLLRKESRKKCQDNDQFKQCTKCTEWLKSERDMRMHMAAVHIDIDPSKIAMTGTKRNSSQVERTNSVSPIKLKIRIKENDENSTKPQIKEVEKHPHDGNEDTKLANPVDEMESSEKENYYTVPDEKIQITTNQKETDPNVRSVPHSIKKLVSEGSKEAIVPGDGTCLIGTTIVHIQGDVENTVQLSRNLNTHLATYRDIYLPKIEADFPLTI